VDPLGAFCAHDPLPPLPCAASGPLAGFSFAVKDVFALAGARACYGNPTWLATHPAAAATAPVVSALLGAGARLCGTTLTDELAFSLTGDNAHYGAPLNPAAPDHFAGGSSAGSAAAVAGGAVDFALGTDTGGSVRVPASHCGLFGFRPSHGSVDGAGVLPLAPRFDTVGWFTRDPATLAQVGDILLPAAPPQAFTRVVLLEDALGLLDPPAAQAFLAAVEHLPTDLGSLVRLAFKASRLGAGPSLPDLLPVYLTLQNAEIARQHRAFVTNHRPRFGPLIAARMTAALLVTSQQEETAEQQLLAIRARLESLLPPGTLLLVPSAGDGAPSRRASAAKLSAETGRSLTLSALASLCGLPQISMPLARVGRRPLGVSLLAGRGQDRALLHLVRRIWNKE
jgi:amidase